MAGAGHAYAQDSAYSPPTTGYAQPGYDQPDESYDQPGYAQPDDAYDRPGYDEPPTVGEVTVEAEPAPGGRWCARAPSPSPTWDLSGEAGAYTLLGRIDNAARQVLRAGPVADARPRRRARLRPLPAASGGPRRLRRCTPRRSPTSMSAAPATEP
ncbi:MAG: hypothetical protein WDM92_08350 [Caulobacteraceae bacterium]